MNKFMNVTFIANSIWRISTFGVGKLWFCICDAMLLSHSFCSCSERGCNCSARNVRVSLENAKGKSYEFKGNHGFRRFLITIVLRIHWVWKSSLSLCTKLEFLSFWKIFTVNKYHINKSIESMSMFSRHFRSTFDTRYLGLKFVATQIRIVAISNELYLWTECFWFQSNV